MPAEFHRRVSDSEAPASGPLLLVVDDDQSICQFLSDYAEFSGFRVATCTSGRDALTFLDRQAADLALIDLRMPEIDGLEVIRAVRQKAPSCQLVLMSGAGTIGAAVEAIKLGARDYIEKPFDPEVLEALLNDVKAEAKTRRNTRAVEHHLAPEFELCGMLGGSAVMQDLFALVRRLAPHVKSAFITGESGTGKELVARAMHQLGPRHAQEFVAIGCAGLVESHGESELFGHVSGAFAGANEDHRGAFERADGGVLFLDQVSELPPALQGRLLRTLEDGHVTPVGSHAPRTVDVVVIAATHRDLRTEMMAGRFRQDLYYRLSSASLRVPPLRERKEDIPLLTAAFVVEFSKQLGRNVVGFTAAAEALLQQGEWRGNVRQLRNTIERACMLADGNLITEQQLMQVFQMSRPGTPARL